MTRDLKGYGRTPPDPHWRGGARVAVAGLLAVADQDDRRRDRLGGKILRGELEHAGDRRVAARGEPLRRGDGRRAGLGGLGERHQQLGVGAVVLLARRLMPVGAEGETSIGRQLGDHFRHGTARRFEARGAGRQPGVHAPRGVEDELDRATGERGRGESQRRAEQGETEATGDKLTKHEHLPGEGSIVAPERSPAAAQGDMRNHSSHRDATSRVRRSVCSALLRPEEA